MLLLLVLICVFAAFSSLSIAILVKPRASAMETRIQDFRNRASTFREEVDVDLDLAFVERILKPGVEAVANAGRSVLPASVLADLQHQLLMAGNPMRLNTFVTFWMTCIAVFGGLGIIMFASMPADAFMQKLGLLALFGTIGYMAPRAWLKGKVKAKQKLVLKTLPDTLDLITTCVEAGLGLDAALARVAEKGEGPLAEELTHMLRDVAMGKLRREALIELGERIGVEELTNFINSVIQAEQLGVGIAQVLRVQSDQLRMQRRQRAEKSAHEAPIKMLFPLVLFVFPAFLAVILGPAMIRIATAL
jgi:tight adherence protein C